MLDSESSSVWTVAVCDVSADVVLTDVSVVCSVAVDLCYLTWEV